MRTHVLSIAVIALLMLSGCRQNHPSEIGSSESLARAKQAGALAAAGYLTIHKPTPEEAKAVRLAARTISKNLKSYKDGGFKALAPEIKRQVGLEIKEKEHLVLANTLIDVLVGELDNLFNKHPEWKAPGEDVVRVIATFCDSAYDTLGQAGVKSKEKALDKPKEKAAPATNDKSYPPAKKPTAGDMIWLDGKQAMVVERGKTAHVPPGVTFCYLDELVYCSSKG